MRYSLLLLITYWIQVAGSIRCYHCANVTNTSLCNITTVCPTNEVCFQQTLQLHDEIRVFLGCQHVQVCGGAGQTGNAFGRALLSLDKRDAELRCHECCSTELCNNQLCSHTKSSVCADDVTFDCARVSSIFGDVCKDVHHAQIVCPKFCGLCPRDGQWTNWGNWSHCDVTCDVGIRTRSRSCSNPAPVNGGLDCVGNNSQLVTCEKNPCPVNGGWSTWSPWGECSVTCDVGIERRDRSCSNPYPDKGGDHCYGDSRDDRICMLHPCVDGGWSTWGDWENCSATCGGGVKYRHRSCDNPKPSSFGRQCLGSDEQPTICNNNNCEDDTVAFSAYNVTTDGILKDFIFNSVQLNVGNAYNVSNGYFMAPKDGLYSFTVQMCTLPMKIIGLSITKTTVNNHEIVISKAALVDNEAASCASFQGLTTLKVNERVSVKRTNGEASFLTEDSFRSSSFSGMKVSN